MIVTRQDSATGVTPACRPARCVELELAPASGTTSLAGGYLLQTRLREMMLANGTTPKEGSDFCATARGAGDDRDQGRAQQPQGRPRPRRPCGGQEDAPVQPDHPRRTAGASRPSAIIETVVNQRFHFADGVNEAGAAKGKTDQFLELKVPRVYHHNQERYFRVVKLLPIIDNPALRAERQQAWGQELLDPKTAGVAALKLEGLGTSAVETLKRGLESSNSQVRFMAAEALAYLDDVSGVDVLGAIATDQREFRAYALAALSSIDQAAAHMMLRKLMDVADVEVRYGAFDALRTLDENDPFLGRVRVLDDPSGSEDESQDDSMALAIAARGRRNRPEDPFALYLVDCEGPPMVHVANTRRCEVVLFGRSQKLLTPLVLGTGAILLNASDGDKTIQVSKIVADPQAPRATPTPRSRRRSSWAT